jgi:hypothetical protein
VVRLMSPALEDVCALIGLSRMGAWLSLYRRGPRVLLRPSGVLILRATGENGVEETHGGVNSCLRA